MTAKNAPRDERVVRLPLGELHYYKGYPALKGIMPTAQPYQVRDDDPTMIQLAARVRERGVRLPIIVRPDPDGGYEIVAGHRRHRASELAGLEDIPVIIREMTDEEAAMEVVDTNVQRENTLPSERAWAYRLRLEVEKRSVGRPSKNAPHNAANYRSDDEVGKSLGISGDTLRRWADLTELIPPLLDKVDAGEIGPTPAFSLSALTQEEQSQLLDAMAYAQAMPSTAQAKLLKKHHTAGTLTVELMREILSEEKKAEQDMVILESDTLRKYFPMSYTPLKMQETIIRLLEQWQKKRQRDQER